MSRGLSGATTLGAVAAAGGGGWNEGGASVTPRPVGLPASLRRAGDDTTAAGVSGALPSSDKMVWLTTIRHCSHNVVVSSWNW